MVSRFRLSLVLTKAVMTGVRVIEARTPRVVRHSWRPRLYGSRASVFMPNENEDPSTWPTTLLLLAKAIVRPALRVGLHPWGRASSLNSTLPTYSGVTPWTAVAAPATAAGAAGGGAAVAGMPAAGAGAGWAEAAPVNSSAAAASGERE